MNAISPVLTCLVAGFLVWTAPPAPAADEVPQSPFEKECHANAMLLERDVNANDAGFVERYFDTDACVDRGLTGVNAPGRVLEDFRRGAPGGFFKTFANGLLEANSVRLVRMHREGKETRFLFRIAPKQGGVDYLDLVFEKTRRGGARVVDGDVLGQGRSLSQLLREQFLPLAKDPGRGFLDQLTARDREMLEQLPQVERMGALNGGARYTEVVAIYNRLPEGVQKGKPALLQQLAAAVQVDPRGLAAGLDLWRSVYPGDISIELIAANLQYGKRNYEAAFAALDRFERAMGGDAYLDVVRAQWQKNQGNLDQARPYARKAVTRNPKLHEGWEMLIGLGLATRQYGEVAQALTDWEKASQVNVVRVAESEKLAEFARSPEGRQWLASRDARRPAGAASPAPAAGGATARSNHKLQGIFYTASNPSAIINGRTVFTGDRLVGGFRVERISPKSVTLLSPEGQPIELAFN